MLYRLQNLYKVPMWTVLFISNEQTYLVESKMLLLCLDKVVFANLYKFSSFICQNIFFI